MKRLLTLCALLLTMGLSMHGVAAQVSTGDGSDLEEAEGLTAAVSRSYAAAESSDDDAYRAVMVEAYTFDSEDNAKAFLEETRSQLDKELSEESGVSDTESSDMETIDKEGFELELELPDEGIAISVMAFVDGSDLFVVLAMDEDLESATSLTESVANYVVDNDVENDEVTFNADGTSTGGLFDRMPASEDDAVDGLPADEDADRMNLSN